MLLSRLGAWRPQSTILLGRSQGVTGKAHCIHQHAHLHYCALSKPPTSKVATRALKKDQQTSSGLDPSLEMAVPPDQRPVNELANLKQALFYSWVRP